jgi:aminomethyltransferase
MVEFGGWEMPIQYPSGILAEARAVRRSVGMFDVSHMGRLFIGGDGADGLLQRVFTQDVRAMEVGRCRYGFLLNERGGILDDVIVSRTGPLQYLLVCNAANRQRVAAWLRRWMADYSGIMLDDQTDKSVMVAVQGPQAIAIVADLTSLLDFPEPLEKLRSFRIGTARVFAVKSPAFDWFEHGVSPLAVHPTYLQPRFAGMGYVSRTGYTGEIGVEVIVAGEHGVRLWDVLAKAGVTPCGLGARDVLRLEAGLPLHGNDITADTTPLEAGLEQFVAWENASFIGREALERQRDAGVKRKLVGFRLRERGVPRHGYAILDGGGEQIGEVTSGTHSPTLDAGIGMGYVAAVHASPDKTITIDVRGRQIPAVVTALPFYSRKA